MNERTPFQRFWAKVHIHLVTGCWEWQGGHNQYGYGCFALTHEKNALAHRYAYETFVEPIPDGLQIDHLCRNRNCVNPRHMEPVGLRENLVRGERSNQYKGRTHCRAGHEYTPENTRINPHGIRLCRTCHRLSQERAKVRAREKRHAK
jgi:hypothetical protein